MSIGFNKKIIVLLICLSLLFAGLATGVFVTGQAVGIDMALANLLFAARNSVLVKILWLVTMLGKWWVAMITVLVVAALFYVKGYKKYIIPLFVSVGASFVTGMMGKNLWQRSRPAGIAVYLEDSWSFPSGHSILAMSLYGFLAYFFWRQFKKTGIRGAALALGLLIILLIGFSRLYLGVHYLSDVLAGYLVGAFWLVISIAIENRQNKIAPTQEVEANKNVL